MRYFRCKPRAAINVPRGCSCVRHFKSIRARHSLSEWPENATAPSVLVGDKDYLSRQYRMCINTNATCSRSSLSTWKPRSARSVTRLLNCSAHCWKCQETHWEPVPQLCDQFLNRRNRNYAKSFHGLATRIVSKLNTLTLIQCGPAQRHQPQQSENSHLLNAPRVKFIFVRKFVGKKKPLFFNF